MTPSDVQTLALDRLGLRLGPEMAAYVLRQLADPSVTAPVPIIAGNARTGCPVRLSINPHDLAPPAAPPDHPA